MSFAFSSLVKRVCLISMLGVALSTSLVGAGLEPLPFKIAGQLADAADILSPADVQVSGWLGARILLSEKNRLLTVDTVPLLAGYHKKPGSHPWIGEHVGKWIHAATLAWANTGDRALKEKLDRVVAELISTQEPDGYLGTYLPADRFNLSPGPGKDEGWDVWSHKYNLIALETYYQYTGNEAALATCRKMADLLIATFPSKLSIVASAWHAGMPSTSVLEPIVGLYRLTGDERYLAFARYILRSWDEPKGPAIMSALLAGKGVDQIGNAKAYEMLSNLVGLCELARVTGDTEMLVAAKRAWQDIVANQLYITGSSSQWERFQADHELRSDPGAHLGETCVTVTWIQFNLELLRLTGEAQYGDELERSFYNHLAAAQNPRGEDWCYYTPLIGTKQYDDDITCCHSSGPRGMALIPQSAYLHGKSGGDDALLVNTLETSRVTMHLGGEQVTIEQKSEFPQRGSALLTMHLANPAKFAVKVRTPSWAMPLKIASSNLQDGWTVVDAKQWKEGDQVQVNFALDTRMIAGNRENTGNEALAWGPFVLACDQKDKAEAAPLNTLELLARKPPYAVQIPGRLDFRVDLVGRPGAKPLPARFIPFADVGADGSYFRIWFRAPGISDVRSDPLSLGRQLSQSRGNPGGTTTPSQDYPAFLSTSDGKLAATDWFSIALPAPVAADRIVFFHGRSFPNGGWFDASEGKPKVQIRRSPDGAWETVGDLPGYPGTTASKDRGLPNGKSFVLRLPKPITVVAVRIFGKPAAGQDPTQAFATCGGLQVFRD